MMMVRDDSISVKDYLKTIRNFPVLTREEEQDLFRRAHQGEEQAKKRILQCNLRFVVKIALEFVGKGLPLSDLIQEGNLGLMEVIKRFDPDRGYRFSTYAAFWIRQSIQMALKRHGSFIRLPVRKSRLLGKIEEKMKRTMISEGRVPTNQELSDHLDIEEEKIEEVLRFREAVSSLEQPLVSDQNFSLAKVIADDKAKSPRELCDENHRREKIQELLNHLTPREAEVIRLRFGFTDGTNYSLRQASKRVGLTQEGVRRVELRALHKLRRPTLREKVASLI